MQLIWGVIGFGFLLMFDLIKTKGRSWGLLFALGGSLIALSTIMSLPKGWTGRLVDSPLHCFLTALLIIELGALVYALFIAIPVKTYTASQKDVVVKKGLYAICRHPGFWLLLLFYALLLALFGGQRLLWALIVFNCLNFIYICVQDAYIFPKYIDGYCQYKEQVPFLLPRLCKRR